METQDSKFDEIDKLDEWCNANSGGVPIEIMVQHAAKYIAQLVKICRDQELRIQQLEKCINSVVGNGILPSKEQFM